jgi:hypothetical protein
MSMNALWQNLFGLDYVEFKQACLGRPDVEMLFIIIIMKLNGKSGHWKFAQFYT